MHGINGAEESTTPAHALQLLTEVSCNDLGRVALGCRGDIFNPRVIVLTTNSEEVAKLTIVENGTGNLSLALSYKSPAESGESKLTKPEHCDHPSFYGWSTVVCSCRVRTNSGIPVWPTPLQSYLTDPRVTDKNCGVYG